MRKVSGIAALVLGIVLVAAAGIVKWSLADKMAVLPGNMETTRVFAGTAAVLVNPASLGEVKTGPGLLKNVPITVRHYTKVIKTQGRNALVADERTVMIPGYTAADLKYKFGLDRHTFEAAGNFPDAATSHGLTINWPIDTQKHDYTGWVIDTQRTTTLHYVGEAKRGGIDTYVFKASGPPETIRDPELLKILPPSMTKTELLGLTPSLQLSMKELKKMSKTLEGLPDPVPLTYTYQANNTYWVAPTSGVVVDALQHEVRKVAFVDGNTTIPVSTLMDMTYSATPHTMLAAANDARNNASQLKLIRRTVPLVALIGGIGLIVLGAALLAWRRRRPPVPAAPVPPSPVEEREPVGVG